jgi:hypothetical protein
VDGVTATAGSTCDCCGGAAGPSLVGFEHGAFYRVHPATDGPPILIAFERGWWGACVDCASDVRARAWRQIIDRHLEVRRTADGTVPPWLRAELAGLFLALNGRLTGVERSWPTMRGAA